METLQNKIDFALVIAVHHANPNGDPLNGNRPRETYDGYGEISDCLLYTSSCFRMKCCTSSTIAKPARPI